MTPEQDDTEAPLLLVVTWHFPVMRVMPRAFLHVRALDRASRGARSLQWMHRWVSRRSVALTSRWAERRAAEQWMASPAFRGADEAFARMGATRRIEAAARPVSLNRDVR